MCVASIEPLKTLKDDGLPTLEIGPWGEEKYRHVQLYASLFIINRSKILEGNEEIFRSADRLPILMR